MTNCPHIWSTDEGTSGCELAAVTAKQYAKREALLKQMGNAIAMADEWLTTSGSPLTLDEVIRTVSDAHAAYHQAMGKEE